MLIGISGKIGAGKNSFADIVKEKLPDFEIKAFADKLKFMTSYLTGVDLNLCYTQEGKNIFLEEWGMTVGQFQQKLGTEAMRNSLHTDGWILSLFADYIPESSNWIITDVRFPNEANAIRYKRGLLIRIEGDPAKVRENSTRDLQHASETSLDTWEHWDYKFTNEPPIENLYKRVDDFISIFDLLKSPK